MASGVIVKAGGSATVGLRWAAVDKVPSRKSELKSQKWSEVVNPKIKNSIWSRYMLEFEKLWFAPILIRTEMCLKWIYTINKALKIHQNIRTNYWLEQIIVFLIPSVSTTSMALPKYYHHTLSTSIMKVKVHDPLDLQLYTTILK